MNDYGISYRITTDKPLKSDIFWQKINNTEYIIYDNIDSNLKKLLCYSMLNVKLDKLDIKDANFGSKQYFGEVLTQVSGVLNATYLITSNLENIVDPIAKQILINQKLPYQLKDIMKYMAEKTSEGFIQDRNDLAAQRIRGSEVLVHLLQKQILSAYTVYREQVLAGNKNAEFLIQRNKVLSQFRMSEIVTTMEYSNPVEEMTTITRISPIGKNIGGIPGKEAVQMSYRNVHKSFYGNIDPLDTPEGDSVGVSRQLAIGAGLTSARGLFKIKAFDDKEASGILSTSSSMIPFIENNEGARVMMGVNQAKQVLPLKNPEIPAVMTGYESILTSVLSPNFIKKAEEDGLIIDANKDVIIIQYGKTKSKIDLSPIHLKSGFGRDTLSVFELKVRKGQRVKKGSILAEGSCIKQGTISMGKNLLVAMMPYRGFNFDDAVTISDKLITGDMLTSLYGIKEDVLLSEKDRLLYICDIGDRIEKGQPILRKTIGEIEELLGYQEDDDTAVFGQELVRKSPGGVIVDIDVFANTDISKYPKLEILAKRTRQRRATPKEKFVIRGKTIKGVLIQFKIQQELKIDLGDKITGRFGNKGIISLIEREEDMPKTPWGDRIDIILNPIGLIGRMNPGQLLELYTGLISKNLAERILKSTTRSRVINLLKIVLSKLDNTENKNLSTGFIKKLESLGPTQFKAFLKEIQDSGFFPIIVPPFRSPKAEQIKDVLRLLGLKSGYKLFIPYYNTTTKNEVPVGYMYINKLEHIAAMKLHSRSTGPVTGKTGQPTAGKRAEGGQRLGEADTYAIMAYNAPHLLSELMGPMSDDSISKNEIISDIIQTGQSKFRATNASPAKDLLMTYFIALMLDQRRLS
jgi:DNA-directed RNA polymerase subunit beta